jgi:D-alanyl-D-alanine carboxypeptidase
MVSALADMRVWSRALATGALLKPVGWKEANKDAVPFESAQSYNGPGRWKYGLGFVESGRFIGGTGSFAGYNSTAMYSPARRSTSAVVSTKQPNPVTTPPMFQALATVVFGRQHRLRAHARSSPRAEQLDPGAR